MSANKLTNLIVSVFGFLILLNISSCSNSSTVSQNKKQELRPNTPIQIAMIDRHRGLVLSESGKMFITENGWNSWQNISKPYGVLSLAKINNVVYLATNQKRIYQSLDGGRNWKYQGNLPSMPSLIKFVSPSIGFANLRDTRRSFLKTFDYGKTWKFLTVKRNNVPTMISFASSTLAFGIKDNLIMKSKDSGITWFEVLKLPARRNTFSFIAAKNNMVAAWETRNKQLALSYSQGRSWNEDDLGKWEEVGGDPFWSDFSAITHILLIAPKTVLVSDKSRTAVTFDGEEYRGSAVYLWGEITSVDYAENQFLAATNKGYILKLSNKTWLWKDIAQIK